MSFEVYDGGEMELPMWKGKVVYDLETLYPGAHHGVPVWFYDSDGLYTVGGRVFPKVKDGKVVVEEMPDAVDKALQKYAERHRSFTVRMNVYSTGSSVLLTKDTEVHGRVVPKGSYLVYSARIRDIELRPGDCSSDSAESEGRCLDVYSDIRKEYDAAKKKHPEFAEDPKHGLSIIMEELGELAKEINDSESGWKERAITEAAHVAVTAIRMMEKLKELT